MWLSDHMIGALSHMESAFSLEGLEIKVSHVFSKPCTHNKASQYRNSKEHQVVSHATVKKFTLSPSL